MRRRPRRGAAPAAGERRHATAGDAAEAARPPLLEPVTLALRPAHWESARVDADTAPRMLPASSALLDTQRPMDALLA